MKNLQKLKEAQGELNGRKTSGAYEDNPHFQVQLSNLYSPIIQQKQHINNNLPIVVGVSGGHSSGKIYFSEMLKWYLQKSQIESKIIKQENFEKRRSDDGKKIMEVDFSSLSSCLNEVQSRGEVDAVIIEGTLVFEDKNLLQKMGIKVFLDTDDDVRLSRIVYKDVCIRNESVTESVERYLRELKPIFEERVLPTKRYADIVIPNYGDGYSDRLSLQTLSNHKEIAGFTTIDDPVFDLLAKNIVNIIGDRKEREKKYTDFTLVES